MWLITARTIEEFAWRHADARQALADWCASVEAATWRSDAEVRSSFPRSCRPIGKGRVVFNIKGNHYRIVCSMRYADIERGLRGQVRVEFIGTHAEYDSIDAATVSFRPPRLGDR